MMSPGSRYSRGLTLLEVLVALAIFAVVSVIAYGGLRAVLETDQATRQQAASLAELQRAVSWLDRDLEQLVSRPIRGRYGDTRPSFDGSNKGYLEWTRLGWSNPAQQLRSTLQRVAYRLEDGNLVRSVWYVLDRAQDTVPRDTVLLEGVQHFSYRMLDQNRQWQEVWPGYNDLRPLVSLPLAVELVLDTERWGRIRRLVSLPEGG